MKKKQKAPNFFLVLALSVGLVAGLFLVQHSTEDRQHASQFNDLNSSDQITDVNNPDGTMGPVDYSANYANTLPEYYLGTLELQVTDPSQGKRPLDVPPTHVLPTQAHGNGPDNNNGQDNKSSTASGEEHGGGPQNVKSLVLTVTKAEVHVAHFANPGEKITPPAVSPTQEHGKSDEAHGQKTNQDVNKWETLNIGGTQTFDLVQLAASKSFSSLGLTKLAGGLYTEVRLYVAKATATLSDGSTVTLNIPGKANIVRIVEPFTIVSGKTTTVSVDFDAQNSVIKAGNVYLLKPVVAHFTHKNQD